MHSLHSSGMKSCQFTDEETTIILNHIMFDTQPGPREMQLTP